MNKVVRKALDKLEAGKWNAGKALAAIEAGSARPGKSAKWLKVRVVEDGKKKFNLRLPLGAMSLLLVALNPLLKWALRHAAEKHSWAKLPIDKLDIRRMLKILASYGPMTVVEIKDSKTEVLVQTT